MSELEVSRKEVLTRKEAARRLSTLAAALAGGDSVEIQLGASTVKMHVPDHVQCEIEVEIDQDEVELEVELKWPTKEAPAKGTKK
jgi:amphi-Trp domain-containing protein